jgi:hypothetical protein
MILIHGFPFSALEFNATASERRHFRRGMNDGFEPHLQVAQNRSTGLCTTRRETLDERPQQAKISLFFGPQIQYDL